MGQTNDGPDHADRDDDGDLQRLLQAIKERPDLFPQIENLVTFELEEIAFMRAVHTSFQATMITARDHAREFNRHKLVAFFDQEINKSKRIQGKLMQVSRLMGPPF